MQKMFVNKSSVLRILLGVYLFPLYLVCFSLGVPPEDLPFCGLMFVIAAVGWVLARRESRAWRVIWTSALIISVACGVMEVVAGKRIAHQRSKDAASLRFVEPTPCPLPRAKNGAREGGYYHGPFSQGVALGYSYVAPMGLQRAALLRDAEPRRAAWRDSA
jgi:hypothetical protein